MLNIVLMGFMGTGKTTVGRRLAQRLNMEFVDMDSMIEARDGRAITEIFAQSGEPCFRRLERNLVRELSAGSGRVIATGGGIVLDHRNLRDFERTGLVVCLRADPHTILARVEHETHRPLLAVGDRLERIRSLLEKRQEHYDAVRHQLDTTALTVDAVVERILLLYGKRDGQRPGTAAGAPTGNRTPVPRMKTSCPDH